MWKKYKFYRYSENNEQYRLEVFERKILRLLPHGRIIKPGFGGIDTIKNPRTFYRALISQRKSQLKD